MQQMEFWTKSEAAQRCRLAQRTLERAIADGDLVAYKVGRRVLLSPADVTAWITGATPTGGAV